MKKLHELSGKAQQKAIKTIRGLLSCGFYMNNHSICDYCESIGARFDNSGNLIMFLKDDKNRWITKKTWAEFIRDNYSRSDIISFWNKYCKAEIISSEIIYPMEQFTSIFGDNFQVISPKLLEFSTYDKYFRESDNGFIYSYFNEEEVFDKVIDFYDLLPWLIENPQDDKMKKYIEENS